MKRTGLSAWQLAKVWLLPPGDASTSAALHRFSLAAAIAVVIAIADQVTKRIVEANLVPPGIQLVGGLLRLDYTRNSGAAFGFFPNGGIALVIVAVAVVFGILVSYHRVASCGWFVRCSLGLIAGGACGNLLDRVRLGYVVDFIHLRWWPVFNLADSAISIGVVLLAVHSLRRTDDPKPT